MIATQDIKIYQRKNGTYATTVKLPTGKRKDLYGKSEDEVREKAKTLLHQVGTLGYLEGITTVSGWLEQWLTDMEGTVDPQTMYQYTWAVKRHLIPRLGTVPLSEMTYGVVNNLLNEMEQDKYSVTTRRLIRRILRQAMRRAVQLKLVENNVVHASKNPADDEDPDELKVLLPEEITRLFETLQEDGSDGRNRVPKDAMLALMLATGLRRGEVLGLPWRNVDLNRGLVKVRQQLVRRQNGTVMLKRLKTRSSRRTLPIPPVVVTLLKVHRARQQERQATGIVGQGDAWDLVFTNADGNSWDPNHIRRWFRHLCRRSGVDERCLHDIRHTALTFIAAANGIEAAQKIAGHKHVSTTADVYNHLIPQTAAAIANHMQGVLMLDDGDDEEDDDAEDVS